MYQIKEITETHFSTLSVYYTPPIFCMTKSLYLSHRLVSQGETHSLWITVKGHHLHDEWTFVNRQFDFDMLELSLRVHQLFNQLGEIFWGVIFHS